MLRKVLRLLEQGGLHTVSDIATALDTSEAIAEQMVERLTRWGYLTPLGGCAATCSACPAQGHCQSPAVTRTRVFAFTPGPGGERPPRVS